MLDGRRWPAGESISRCVLLVVVALTVFACRRGDEPSKASSQGSVVADAAAGSGAEAEAPRLAPVASVGMAEAWLDLIAQRPSAVVFSEGRMLIEMGELTARRHLQLARGSPWQLGEVVDGRNAAVLVGRTGTLTIPLDGPLAPAMHPDVDEKPQLAVAVTMRGLADKQMATVLWNETPVVNLRVSDEWERRTISVPQALARPGENRLRLHFRNLDTWSSDGEVTEQGAPRGGQGASAPAETVRVSAAIELVEVGTVDAIRDGVPNRETYAVEPRADAGSTLRLPGGTSLVFYVIPPRRARLSLDVSGRGGLEVVASTDADHRAGRAPNVLHQSSLRETGTAAEVDLSGYAGEPTRIEIRVRGRRAQQGVETLASFRSMAVTARRSVPMDRRGRAPRDLYVVAIEGGRYDDLVEDRDRDAPLPNLDRLIAESLVFERAYALGAAAVPSHAGWLTSEVPPSHLTVRGTFVAEGRTLLAEVLDRAGYFSVAITANADVNAERGLTQGIGDHQVLHRGPTKANTATGVMTRVIEQMEARPSPRFVYAVFNDPQAPYDPPQEVFDEPLLTPEGAPAQHLTHMWVSRVRREREEIDAGELEYVRRLYRGELQVIDRAVGQLISTLEARDELDDAIIVLVGIHGEEFMDHGSAGHGHALFDESVHVPLMIRAPKLLAAGRVAAPVDLLDLAPTLLDLLGLEFPADWQGESLVPVIDDPQPSPRLVVSHLGDGSRAAVVGDHKLVLGPGRGPDAEAFYDLKRDPREQTSLGDEGGVALRVVRTALGWELADEVRWKRARWGTGANLRPAFALDHGM